MDIGATTPRPGFAGNNIVRNALFLVERMIARIQQTEIPLKVLVDSSLSGQAWLVSYSFFLGGVFLTGDDKELSGTFLGEARGYGLLSSITGTSTTTYSHHLWPPGWV